MKMKPNERNISDEEFKQIEKEMQQKAQAVQEKFKTPIIRKGKTIAFIF